MSCRIRVIGLGLASFVLAAASEQRQPPQKAPAAQNQSSDARVFGQSYSTLRPEQKHLINDLVRRYNQTTDSKIVPEEACDGARMSVRTTFDAVTHALLTTELSNDKGQSLGRAIDLVSAVDDVMGEEARVRGDRQFRMYVYLKPNAFEVLAHSSEFYRDKDNTTYHKGFPLCFRLKRGPRPSSFRFRGTNVCPISTWTIARPDFPKRCSTDT